MSCLRLHLQSLERNSYLQGTKSSWGRIREKSDESLCKKCPYFSPLTATPHCRCLKSSKIISNQTGPQVSSLLSPSLDGSLTDHEIHSLPAFSHTFRVQVFTTNHQQSKAIKLCPFSPWFAYSLHPQHLTNRQRLFCRSSLAFTDQWGRDQNCLSHLPTLQIMHCNCSFQFKALLWTISSNTGPISIIFRMDSQKQFLGSVTQIELGHRGRDVQTPRQVFSPPPLPCPLYLFG